MHRIRVNINLRETLAKSRFGPSSSAGLRQSLRLTTLQDLVQRRANGARCSASPPKCLETRAAKDPGSRPCAMASAHSCAMGRMPLALNVITDATNWRRPNLRSSDQAPRFASPQVLSQTPKRYFSHPRRRQACNAFPPCNMRQYVEEKRAFGASSMKAAIARSRGRPSSRKGDRSTLSTSWNPAARASSSASARLSSVLMCQP